MSRLFGISDLQTIEQEPRKLVEDLLKMLQEHHGKQIAGMELSKEELCYSNLPFGLTPLMIVQDTGYKHIIRSICVARTPSNLREVESKWQKLI